MDAIILAGGKGTRLSGVYTGLKPMAPLYDRPFVHFVVQHLIDQGVTRLIFAVGYKHNTLIRYFEGRRDPNVEYIFSIEYEPLGTAGAVRNALRFVEHPEFLVVNGDTFCDFKLRDLLWEHMSEDALLTALYTKSGVHTGVCMVNTASADNLILEEDTSLELEVLARTNHNRVTTTRQFFDIGTPESYQNAEQEIHKWLFVRQPFIVTRTNLGVIVREGVGDIILAAQMVKEAIQNGNKVMWCGNGGSAAMCQHLSAELVGRFVVPDREPLASISLTTDTSYLTAQMNDELGQELFSRQVEALGERGDVLILMSTSGESPNILDAVGAANKKGVYTIGFTGNTKSTLESCVDIALVAPDYSTPRIQECHLVMGHTLCDLVEHSIFVKGWRR